MSKYIVNSYIELCAQFFDEDTIFNPSTVTLKIKKPDGQIYTFSTDNDEITSLDGTYSLVYYVDSVGMYSFRWECSGNAFCVTEDSFYAINSRI